MRKLLCALLVLGLLCAAAFAEEEVTHVTVFDDVDVPPLPVCAGYAYAEPTGYMRGNGVRAVYAAPEAGGGFILASRSTMDEGWTFEETVEAETYAAYPTQFVSVVPCVTGEAGGACEYVCAFAELDYEGWGEERLGRYYVLNEYYPAQGDVITYSRYIPAVRYEYAGLGFYLPSCMQCTGTEDGPVYTDETGRFCSLAVTVCPEDSFGDIIAYMHEAEEKYGEDLLFAGDGWIIAKGGTEFRSCSLRYFDADLNEWVDETELLADGTVLTFRCTVSAETDEQTREKALSASGIYLSVLSCEND